MTFYPVLPLLSVIWIIIHGNQLIAPTLLNEGAFVCVLIDGQWTNWLDCYLNKSFLIYFIKDWNFLSILAEIFNNLGDRVYDLKCHWRQYCN